jgi:putative transcriptional regulator
MKPTNIQPMPGSILISEPALKDMYFQRAVVLLAEHNNEGSFGLILNKPLDVQFNDIVKGFPQFDAKVYLGGPVNTKNLFFLHKRGDFIRNSQPIKEGWFWGGEIDDVKSLIQLGEMAQEDIRFYIGYSGWSENQLNEELKEFSWLVSDPDLRHLIEIPSREMWKQSVADLGKDYEMWMNFPSDPTLN